MTFSELPRVRDTCTILSLHPPTDFIFSFASTATKKISESVVETAQTIKKTVEEGKIDNIIDKVWSLTFLRQILQHLEAIVPQCVEVSGMSQGLTHLCVFQTILGDFQKEQEKFVQEKKSKKSGTTTGKNIKLFIPPGSVQYFWEIKFKFASLFPVTWLIRSCTVLGVDNCPLKLLLQRMQNIIQTECSRQGLQVWRAPPSFPQHIKVISFISPFGCVPITVLKDIIQFWLRFLGSPGCSSVLLRTSENLELLLIDSSVEQLW